jgi:hypothetical protein
MNKIIELYKDALMKVSLDAYNAGREFEREDNIRLIEAKMQKADYLTYDALQELAEILKLTVKEKK